MQRENNGTGYWIVNICLKLTSTWWRWKLKVFPFSFSWRQVKTKNMREFWPNRYRPHEKTFFYPRPRPSTLDMLPSTLDPRLKPTLFVHCSAEGLWPKRREKVRDYNRKIFGASKSLPKKLIAELRRPEAGRLYVGRWNERVRAKRCDAVDWGLLKQGDSTYLHSNLDFERNYTKLPSIWIRNFFTVFLFCGNGKR